MSQLVIPRLTQLSTLLATTNGRDKVLGIFDYLARASSYYVDEKSPNAQMVKALEVNLLLVLYSIFGQF